MEDVIDLILSGATETSCRLGSVRWSATLLSSVFAAVAAVGACRCDGWACAACWTAAGVCGAIALLVGTGFCGEE